MEPRRLLYAAVDVGVRTNRVDGWMWNMEQLLLGKTADGEDQTTPGLDDDAVHPKSDFSTVKDRNQKVLDIIVATCDLVNTVKANVNLTQSFLDITFSKSDIEYDLGESETIASATSASMGSISDASGLSAKAPDFVAFNPKFNINPSPKLHLPSDLIWESCVNDLLDVMSYELQSIHSEDGSATAFTFKQVKDKTIGRLEALRRFSIMPHHSQYEDNDSMMLVYDYINTNLPGASDLVDLAVLGKYISDNVDKMILVRRAWAT